MLDHMKILVVDDNRQTRALLCAVLKAVGAQTIECADGRMALQTIRTTKIDLVLIDYVMQKMDGAEFTRRLRLDPDHCRTAICMITGHGDIRHVRAAVAAGVDGLVTKPFSTGALLKRLAHAWDRSKRRHGGLFAA